MKSKIITISTISLIIILLASLCVSLYILKGKGINKYTLSNQYISLTNKEIDVVFMGNSITQFWYELDPNFFNSNNYISRGVAAERSHQLLARFKDDVLNLNPKIVVINGGLNDIAYPYTKYDPDFTFNCITTMAKLAEREGIKVILTSITPAKSFHWNLNATDVPAKIVAMNARIKQYAIENNMPYVDYYTQMAAEDGDLILEYNEDGVHPLLAGYKVMEPLVKKAIDSLLKK